MIEMELGGVRYLLDPAAISAIRYRSQYGESIVTSLANSENQTERERHLLRICHEMMVDRQKVPLSDYAKQVFQNRTEFLRQAETAVGALLDTDGWTPEKSSEDDDFDEYELLTTMAAVGLDMRLLETLPIMHVARVLDQLGAMKDPERKQYRKMSEAEIAKFYNLHL